MTERDDALTKLDGLLAEIAEVDASTELVRADDLGQANFRLAVPVLDQTIGLFQELKSSDLGIFPVSVLSQLIGRAEVAIKTFTDIRTFTLEGQPDVIAARDQLVARIEKEYDQHFQTLEPHINYLLVRQTDFASMESQARDAMKRLDEFTTQMRAEQEAIRNDMEATLQTVKAAAAEAGVGQQSIVFGEQATADHDNATRWLWSALALAVITLTYLALTLFVWPPTSDTTADVCRVWVRGFSS